MKRSKWKGIFIKPKNVGNKAQQLSKMSRNDSVMPKLIEKTVSIHNGLVFKKITVSKSMLGHKFGEFIKTRAIFEFKKKKKKKKK